jgi:hypothetical protein
VCTTQGDAVQDETGKHHRLVRIQRSLVELRFDVVDDEPGAQVGRDAVVAAAGHQPHALACRSIVVLVDDAADEPRLACNRLPQGLHNTHGL